jgi:hypothetical protein
MNKYSEEPFQFLRRKSSNEAFGTEIIENWYKARAYVLDKLNEVAFSPNSKEHLHVVVVGDSPLMLSIARQVALSAHYLNFVEPTEKSPAQNRTIITIESQKNDIKDILKKEEYFCNLLECCRNVIYGVEDNNDSYVDVELQVVKKWESDIGSECILITEESVEGFFKSKSPNEIYNIDTRKAVFASRVYEIGASIDNIPYEDIHDAKRYSQALEVFQYVQMERPWNPLINKNNQNDLTKIKEALSNIFCSDCFEARERAIKECSDDDEKSYKQSWEKYNTALSMSEHARWVVEKLIMGYRPLKSEERIEDERIMGSKKLKQYREQLKSNPEDPVHIDLCSYADLRRIDPNNMKYDSFLMLAIPDIIKKCSQK